jgi:Bacterial aa3 type cytochrome c oxidase subunit IV
MADHDKDTHHTHGTMDIRTQEKTFAGFIRMVTWGIGISIGILIFMALVNS